MDAMADIWSRSSGEEFLRAMAQGRVEVPAHAAFIGLGIDAVAAGRIEMAWRPGKALQNPGGIVHGGYVAMVLDDAAGLSCATLGERFRPMLTLDLHIDFLRPVGVDVAYVLVGEVAHRGAARLLADARLQSTEGKLVARATGHFVPNQAYDPTRQP